MYELCDDDLWWECDEDYGDVEVISNYDEYDCSSVVDDIDTCYAWSYTNTSYGHGHQQYTNNNENDPVAAVANFDKSFDILLASSCLIDRFVVFPSVLLDVEEPNSNNDDKVSAPKDIVNKLLWLKEKLAVMKPVPQKSLMIMLLIMVTMEN